VQIAHGAESAVTRDLLDGEMRCGYPHRPPFDFRVPTIAEARRDRRGVTRIVAVPIVAGYGFVRFDRAVDPWGTITAVDGVTGVLKTRSGTPMPIRDAELAWLLGKSEESKRIRRGKLGHAAFAPGDQLRVVDGPFTSFPATCVDCDGDTTRARVWIFGRDTVVTLPRVCFDRA
jgi:transcriptional antiterminator NusG